MENQLVHSSIGPADIMLPPTTSVVVPTASQTSADPIGGTRSQSRRVLSQALLEAPAVLDFVDVDDQRFAVRAESECR